MDAGGYVLLLIIVVCVGVLIYVLKKNKSLDNYVVAEKSKEQAYAFKGDLSNALRTETRKSDNTTTGYAESNRDSADSVVFLSFAPAVNNIWFCPECGTSNEERLSGCIVCGSKKVGG